MYFDQYKDKFNQSKGSEGTIISVIKKFRKKQYFVHKRMQNDDFHSIKVDLYWRSLKSVVYVSE